MRIGIIYTAYNSEDYIERSINPWIEAKTKKIGGFDFSIATVSMPFEKFPSSKQDGTLEKLQKITERGDIDTLFCDSNIPVNEWEARNLCLQYFKNNYPCDLFFMLDSDEFYDTNEIKSLFQYIESGDPLVAWYKVCLRNFVFNNKTYLTEPFMPPRIYRNRVGNYEINKFTYDNDINYIHIKNKEEKSHLELAYSTVPQILCNARHYTWLDDQRSRDKIDYQKSRGWMCSYYVNEQGRLDFNPEYYKKYNIPVPSVSVLRD